MPVRKSQTQNLVTLPESNQAMVRENRFRRVLATNLNLLGYILAKGISCVGTPRHTGGQITITVTDTESESFLAAPADMYMTESHTTATTTYGTVHIKDITWSADLHMDFRLRLT